MEQRRCCQGRKLLMGCTIFSGEATSLHRASTALGPRTLVAKERCPDKALACREILDLAATWFCRWLTLSCPGAWALLTMSSPQGKEVDGLLQPWVNPEGLALSLPGSRLPSGASLPPWLSIASLRLELRFLKSQSGVPSPQGQSPLMTPHHPPQRKGLSQ